jgi:signal transduction histidine kinase
LATKIGYDKGIAKAHMNIANSYHLRGDNLRTVQSYLKALTIAEKIKDTGAVSRCYSGIGLVYISQKNYELAEEYLFKALRIEEARNKSSFLSTLYINLGTVYGNQKEYNKEREYYQKALEIDTKDKSVLGQAISYNNIGESYRDEKQYKQALSYFEKSQSLSERINDQEGIMYCFNNKAWTYLGLNQLDSARTAALQSFQMATAMGQDYFKQEIYRTLAEIYKALKNHQEAAQYFELYAQISDSLALSETALKVAQMPVNYELEKEKKLNDTLRTKEEFNKNLILLITGVGLVIVSVFALILFTFNRRYIKINHQLNEEKEERALQAEYLQQKNTAIEQHREDLQALNQVKDKLFSIIAHDFRSPLNSLQGTLNLLNGGNLSESDLQMLLQKLSHKVNDTRDMLDNLLNWAKGQMRGIEVHPQQINLYEIAEEHIRLFQPIADNKKIELQNKLNETLKVSADIDMLRVILRNLLSNAIKFTVRGGVVKIEAMDYAENDDLVQIAVKDTGVGITDEVRDKIFNLTTYYSAEGTAHEKGTGLGLILAKDFVERNGGTIWLESTPDIGSIFYFTMPKVARIATEVH